MAAVFRVYVCECFAYPATAFIWVVVDSQAAIILPAVWLAAAGSAETVAGLAKGELVTYYLASMTLAQFITCHLMWDMAEDVRDGHFSAHLMRPLSYFRHNVARNLAWRVTKLLLFLPIGILVYLLYRGAGNAGEVHFSPAFFISVVLGHVLSYVSAFCVALTALWTTEYQSVMRIYYLPEVFLSGRLVPLSSLPLWAGALAELSHFRYTNAFCVEMLLGKLSAQQVQIGLLAQLGWILFFLALGQVLFARGVRRYSGVGM